MKTPKKIKIAVEFEVREDVWLKLPDDLRDKGTLAQAGIYELTPADLVAFMVMGAALSTPNTPEQARAGSASERGCGTCIYDPPNDVFPCICCARSHHIHDYWMPQQASVSANEQVEAPK